MLDALPETRCRIVLTGGPGGGKTTAADLFRREMGERIVVVPESATLLFSGGFPRYEDEHARRASQTAIYQIQRQLEDVQHARFPDRILLCDRGTVDGAIYWPGAPDDFFEAVGTTLQAELARYDAVVFFQSAAVGHLTIEGGNPVRTETVQEALELDTRLHRIWARHPRFRLIPHSRSFMKKITTGLGVLESLIAELSDGNHPEDGDGGKSG